MAVLKWSVISALLVFSPAQAQQQNFPYRLVLNSEFEAAAVLQYDADSDGEDELVRIQTDNITLMTQCREQTGQCNDMGEFTPTSVLGSGDLDGDGEPEFVIGFTSRDTARVSAWDSRQNRALARNLPFVPEMPPDRKRLCGTKLKIMYLGVVDANGDGQNDVVLAGEVGGWRYAVRGVWALDIRTGKELWGYWVGMNPQVRAIIDLDNDGREEVVVGGYAIGNGNEANGISDQASWVVCLDQAGKVRWRREVGEVFTNSSCRCADIDADGEIEVVVAETGGPLQRENPAKVLVLDGRTGSIEARLETPFTHTSFALADLAGDQRLEVLMSDQDDTVRVYDCSLRLTGKRNLATRLYLCETTNVDRRGRVEILGGSDRSSVVLLDNRLRVLLEERVPWHPGSGAMLPLRVHNGIRVLLTKAPADQSSRSAAMSLYEVIPVDRPVPVWPFAVATVVVLVAGSATVYLLNRSYRSEVNSILKGLVGGAGVVRINLHGKVASVNRAALATLGIEGDAAGRDFAQLCGQAGVPALAGLATSGLKTLGYNESVELALTVGDEKRNVLAKLVRTRRNLLITLENISAVEYLRYVQAWVPVARKLAHGIKNPLGTILGAVEQVEAHSDDKKVNKYTGYVKDEVTRLKKMTDAFMRFTKIEPPTLAPNDVNQLVRTVVAKFGARMKDRVQSEFHLDETLQPVRLDAEAIGSALEIVIENALDAMASGGRLVVGTSVREHEVDGKARRFCCIEVEDSGSGIPEKYVTKVFEPYFTHGKLLGTGLGLALAKKTVEDHHGLIELCSAEGKGTQVRLILPYG